MAFWNRKKEAKAAANSTEPVRVKKPMYDCGKYNPAAAFEFELVFIGDKGKECKEADFFPFLKKYLSDAECISASKYIHHFRFNEHLIVNKKGQTIPYYVSFCDPVPINNHVYDLINKPVFEAAEKAYTDNDFEDDMFFKDFKELIEDPEDPTEEWLDSEHSIHISHRLYVHLPMNDFMLPKNRCDIVIGMMKALGEYYGGKYEGVYLYNLDKFLPAERFSKLIKENKGNDLFVTLFVTMKKEEKIWGIDYPYLLHSTGMALLGFPEVAYYGKKKLMKFMTDHMIKNSYDDFAEYVMRKMCNGTYDYSKDNIEDIEEEWRGKRENKELYLSSTKRLRSKVDVETRVTKLYSLLIFVD